VAHEATLVLKTTVKYQRILANSSCARLHPFLELPVHQAYDCLYEL
jgi:hypothetical protein